jgi:UTP:GlnB (protein PII) uridylyltransferase
VSVTSVLLDILIVLIAAKVAAEIAERVGFPPVVPTVLGAAVQALEAPATPGAEVDFDDDGSPWYTLCEVRCVDRPGLLHANTVGFASAGIDVHSAQVRTLEGVASTGSSSPTATDARWATPPSAP